MKTVHALYRLIFAGLIVMLLAGCAVPTATQTAAIQAAGTASAAQGVTGGGEASGAGDAANAAGESDDSHSREAEPNYAVVFPQDSVNRIDIALSEEAWADLQAEMEEQFGQQGTGNQPGDPGQAPRQPGNNILPPGNAQPGNPPGMGGPKFGDTSYVSSTVTFNGETWPSVGFRYSGNSTLQSSWRKGTQKISFRLDFDEFEDEDPSTADQRFFGFKQIAFKSNAMDTSYLREKVVADIFREAGVVASQTAFYEVYVDTGEGPVYFGVYTAVEVVDDTVIETQFADDSGNVYKPEGSGAAFVDGTFTKASFDKQTNQEESDWSDIQAVFAALHSELRTTDPAAWREGLEAVLDVDAFLRWLAVDTIIQNWDTYGSMAHNYYLYTDPSDGLVTWIPWDNNMALSTRPGEGGVNPDGGKAPVGNKPVGGNAPAGGNRGGPNRSARALDLSTISDQWPLISYLMDDPTYLAKYHQYLEETIQGAFQPEKLAATYQNFHDLIAPSVAKETQGYTQLASPDAFNNSLDPLKQHAQERYNAVVEYLKSNGWSVK